MKEESKAQTLFMIGIALLVLAGVIIYMSLTSPRVYVEDEIASSQVTVTVSNTAVGSVTSARKSAGTSSVAAKTAKSKNTTAEKVSYPINLNTATQEQLETVSGIGENRAYQIIAYREQLGGYTSVEQIKDIRGIGDSTYAKIAPYLTV